MTKGWKNEPTRHALSAMGYRTKTDQDDMMQTDIRKGELVHEVEKLVEDMDKPDDLEKIYMFEPELAEDENGEIHLWLEFPEHHFDVAPPRASGDELEKYMNEANERDESWIEFYEGQIQSTFPFYEVHVSLQDDSPHQKDMDRQRGMWKKNTMPEYYKIWDREGDV